jgi:hypothetical protein
MVALNITLQKYALLVRKSNSFVKKHLSFAEEVAYPACTGYTPLSQCKDSDPQSSRTDSDSDRVVISENIIKVGQDFHIAFGTTNSFSVLPDQHQVQQQPTDSESLVTGLCKTSDKSQSTVHPRRDLDGLEEVIDDIAYRFWECGR